MDIRWKKWINTLCIAAVICLMTAGGVYGLNGTNGAASLQTGVSLDEFEENGYFTNLFQQGLLFQWSKEQDTPWRQKIIREFPGIFSIAGK